MKIVVLSTFLSYLSQTHYLSCSIIICFYRFGPGLVIYWYGFVDELAEETLKHEIILMDRFPLEEEIVYFQPKAIKVAQTL